MIDEPNVPKANVVDVELDKDIAKHAPPAPYPYRLRIKKKSIIMLKFMSCSSRLK